MEKELTVLDIVVTHLRKALKEQKEISCFITTNLFFFDSFKIILPYLKELNDKKLLKKIKIILGQDTLKNAKDFLLVLKNDSISLTVDDFQIMSELMENDLLEIKLLYDKRINLKLYIFNIENTLTVWSGTANFSQENTDQIIELLVPVNPIFQQEKKVYLDFFEKIWALSTTEISNCSIKDLLKESAEAEIVKLSLRKFISTLLQLLDKEYLVKNVSSDLSSLSEIQNMSYYLCLEKMKNYGGVIFNNSIGLSKHYISCLIIKFFLETNKKVLIVYQEEAE